MTNRPKSRPVVQTKTLVSPMFYIPEGAVEFEYSDDEIDLPEGFGEVGDEYYAEDDEAIFSDRIDWSESPEIPTILRVVSQTLRTDRAGKQVVDVIVEIEEGRDADKHEIRVTKL